MCLGLAAFLGRVRGKRAQSPLWAMTVESCFMAKRAKKNDQQSMLPGLEDPAAGAAIGTASRKASTQINSPTTAESSVDMAATDELAELELPPEDVPLRAQPIVDLHGKKVWVIDSMSLIFQVFHAIPNMTSPRGEPVNAVFGFTRDMFTILEQKKPDYLYCALESETPTFRHTLYEQYKQHRSEMPVDLVPQLPQIRRVLAVMGIPVVECEGFEADDVLATIARVTEEGGGECFMVTADKDCRQLITDRVRLYNMRKNQSMDKAALVQDWGVRPDQVVDYQTLVGDAVDNIPGVPLIGPKLARAVGEVRHAWRGFISTLASFPASARRT